MLTFIIATSQGLRQILNIRTFPVSSPDKHFRTVCARSGAAHLCSSYINITTSVSPQAIQTSLAGLTTIYFHHRGSPRHWIIIPPKEKAVFEERMAQAFKPLLQGRRCSKFVHHLSAWINPDLLRQWGIPYFSLTQSYNQLLIFFPHAYYFGYSSGFSIIESKFHAGPHWNYQDYLFCNLESPLCLKAHDGILIQFPKEHSVTPLSEEEDGLQSPTRSPKRLRPSSPGLVHRHYVSPYDQPALPAIYSPHPSPGLPRGLPPSPHRQSSASGNVTYSHDNMSSFDISDDDDAPLVTNHFQSDDIRISRLQQENSALLRDIQLLKAERDQISSRKAMYKARLLDREAYIRELESRTRDAAVDSLREVARLVEAKILDLEVHPGQPQPQQLSAHT
jgi:hypothetical protein